MIGKLSCSWICEYIEKKGYPWQWRRKMYIPGIPSFEKEGHLPFCYCLLPTPTPRPGISVPDPTITRQPHTPQITLQTQFSIILWPYSLLRPSWWMKPALNNSYWYFWSQLGFTGEVLRWKFACKKNSGKYCWDQQSWDCEGNKTELREARLWCSHKGPADGTGSSGAGMELQLLQIEAMGPACYIPTQSSHYMQTAPGAGACY